MDGVRSVIVYNYIYEIDLWENGHSELGPHRDMIINVKRN